MTTGLVGSEMCIRDSSFTHTHTHTHTLAHAHIHTHTHTHALTHAHAHTCTCARTYTHTHTHTHTFYGCTMKTALSYILNTVLMILTVRSLCLITPCRSSEVACYSEPAVSRANRSVVSDIQLKHVTWIQGNSLVICNCFQLRNYKIIVCACVHACVYVRACVRA